LDFPELALREIRFLSPFFGVTKWFFSSDLTSTPVHVHNSGSMAHPPTITAGPVLRAGFTDKLVTGIPIK
jgi:hypothetical protein